MRGKSIVKRIMTTGVAAAMVVTMSGAPVWAATLENGVKGVSADDSAKVGKTLTTAKVGVDKPTVTFSFSGKGASSALIDLSSTKGVIAATKDVSTTVASSALTGSDGKYVGKSTDNLFKASDYDSAGIYAYIVTETAGQTTIENGTMKYDSTDYYVEVKVINDRGTLKISGITAQKITYDSDGKPVNLGDKVDGSETDQGLGGTVAFENIYTKEANSDDPDNPDDKPGDDKNGVTKGLVISKAIVGENKKAGDTFTYSITFTKDENGVNDDLKIKASKAVTNSNNQTVAANTEFTYGTYTFTLEGKENDTDEIDFELPAGTSYVVNETNTQGYTQSAKIIDNGAAEKDATISATGISSVAGSYANVVKYTNTKTGNPLTGIINNYGSLIAVVAIAAGGIVVLTLRRRREDI